MKREQGTGNREPRGPGAWSDSLARPFPVPRSLFPLLCPYRARGFTLIEIVVVIALIGLLTIAVVAAMAGGMDGVRLRGAAKDVAAQLRFTRGQAIVSGRPQAFVIDVDARTWAAPRGRKGALPKSLEIITTTARQEQPARGRAAIRFFPDGSATGGRVRLRMGEAEWRVDVAWLTGEVKLTRGSGGR